ncbi:ATP-dependent endonuclease [Streptomyces sp. ISL-100]|uniref:ATP-dependent nuclease n=1 Tax=Streptomyces sp. ISL-100 TaxID=2819173 RepID=UPI001BE5BDBE|nr:AAA family ATPase [Streptomyces sp. ISL-100]MBT2401128.1 AAA family ATPase [Streptomyces sp. ISL-100]
MGTQSVGSGMYLRSLRVKNFRSCSETLLELQPDITLLVGENNSGKSNLIEAIRLSTTPLTPRNSRWFEESDRSHGGSATDVEFLATFDGLTAIQRAHYTTALDVMSNQAIYGTVYPAGQSSRRVRPVYTAGPVNGPDAELEKRDHITHVYLAPLRDAQRELDSADNNRLLRVIQQLTSTDEQTSFLREANKAFDTLEQDVVLTKTSGAIQGHLDNLTLSVRGQRVSVTFHDYELSRLTRSLRVKMAEHGIDPADLAESGLGYANLLFIATVILELRNAKDAELTLFLVEEPEAHLHPQLQTVLLDYLQEQAGQSAKEDSTGPAGRIQVIATTHSSNLASSVGIEKVVALRTMTEYEDDERTKSRTTRRRTRTISLAKAPLTEPERRKINQYLDVTRAGILFARRVLLVEGVAEAVLLPVIARHCVLHGESVRARRLRRDFHGVTIVNVGSVDFAPYITLLLADIDGCRLLEHLVVITDGDPDLPAEKATDGQGPQLSSEAIVPSAQDGEQEEDDESTESEVVNRRGRLLAHAASLNAADLLFVAEAPHTLEADLLTPVGNDRILEAAYLKQRKRSKGNWAAIMADADPATAFYRKLRKSKKFISKGEFAHDVANAIEDGQPFKAPDYLRAAVLSVLGESTEAGNVGTVSE